jgi:hypothetical protein
VRGVTQPFGCPAIEDDELEQVRSIALASPGVTGCSNQTQIFCAPGQSFGHLRRLQIALLCTCTSALGGIRTPNLLIRSQMLYPLSYQRELDVHLPALLLV